MKKGKKEKGKAVTDKASLKKTLKTNTVKVNLKERDFSIFKFLLEMKFASAEQIFEMHFRSPGSTNPKYCANRLSILKKTGYLRSHRSYDGLAHYLTATKKSHEALMCQGVEDDHLPSAKEEMDYRFFLHDKSLVWLRIYLEKLGLGFKWQSERSIRRALFLSLSPEERAKRTPLADALIPDAIFENKNGEKIFLELEHTIKDPVDYEKKLDRYKFLVRNKRSLILKTSLQGDKLLYVATKEPITKRLDKICLHYSFVAVHPFEEFEKEFRKKTQGPKTLPVEEMDQESQNLHILKNP